MDAAMLLANRLMGQYNVSQAEVLAHEDSDELQKHAGESIVAIKRLIESNKPNGKKQGVDRQGWVSTLAFAMSTFFDCRSYNQKCAYSINIVFYGLVYNTVAAAHAFEMSYNLVLEWARKVKGQGNGKSAKYAYCLGVARSLLNMAKAEKSAEVNLARGPEEDAFNARVEEEELQREAEMDGLAAGLGEETDNDGEDEDMEMDGVVEGGSDSEDDGVDNRSMIERLKSPKKPRRQIKLSIVAPFTSITSTTKHQSKKEPEPKSSWKSSTQLRKFRASAAKIAEDYLEEQELKLSKPKKQTEIKDAEAFQQGIVDGKTIDVRGKKIEG